MIPKFQEDESSLYQSFLGYDNVSGSSIIQSSNYEIVEIHNVQDIKDNFVCISSLSLCFFVFLAYFYKKCLDAFKHVFISVLKGWFK